MHGTYSISVITSDTDLGEAAPYPEITADQWIPHEPGIQIFYASKKTLTIPLIRNLVNTVAPDFIYLNSLYSLRYTIMPLFLLWRSKIQSRVVLSPRGMLRESAIRLKSSKKKIFIQFLNTMRVPEKIRFHATDNQEKKDVLKYFPGAGKVEMISNFSAALPAVLMPVEKVKGSLRCVFISRIMGIKNINFFLNLLSRLPDDVQLEFGIYGEIEDAGYWEESKKIIQSLPANIRITYGGPLPHNKVIPTLEKFHVFVLPTQGENFGHAIFEALSAGRIVLISNNTPWRSLREKEIGWDLSLEKEEQWIGALIELAGFDQSAFDQWSGHCRQYAGSAADSNSLRKSYQNLFS